MKTFALKNARVTHVSLCKRGKNQIKTILKASGRFSLQTVCKADPKEGLLYAIVYAPDVIDSDKDSMSADEIKKMAHGFLANGGNIDVEHNMKPLGNDEVQICETLIVQKGDARFSGLTYDGKAIDPEGSWGMVLKILDPELRSGYESGEWDGVSLFGAADRVPVQTKSDTPQEDEMTPEQMKELAKQIAEETAQAVAKAMKPEPKKEEPVVKAEPKQDEIKFEGDPNKVEDLEAHAEKVLFKSLNLNDPKDMKTWRDHLAKKSEKKEEVKKSDSPEAQELRDEIAKLQAKLQKAEGTSTTVKTEKQEAAPVVKSGLTKAENDAWLEGKKLAEQWNKSRGL